MTSRDATRERLLDAIQGIERRCRRCGALVGHGHLMGCVFGAVEEYAECEDVRDLAAPILDLWIAEHRDDLLSLLGVVHLDPTTLAYWDDRVESAEARCVEAYEFIRQGIPTKESSGLHGSACRDFLAARES